MALADVRAALAAELTAAGVQVSTDPDTPPHAGGVVVGPVQTLERTSPCVFEATIAAWVVTRGPGDAAALGRLEALLPAAVEALRPDAPAALGTYTMAGVDLPAYELTVTRTTTLED